jgi:hypothetical protein
MHTDVKVWRCDRCDKQELAIPAETPRGWSRVVITPLDHDSVALAPFELCVGCSSQTERFLINKSNVPPASETTEGSPE